MKGQARLPARQVYAVLAATIIMFAALLFIVLTSDPTQAPLLVKILFFITLFLTIWGITSLIALLCRRKFKNKSQPEPFDHSSFLYGLTFSIVVMIIIFIHRL